MAIVGEVLPVKARAHKRFFIEMITRDISLEACVLDLVDNSVDGATRELEQDSSAKRSKNPKPHPLSSGGSRYQGFSVDIRTSRSEFSIRDNCGGLSVSLACENAFNFGRNPELKTEGDTDEGIGIYGVGMKRALFKLGNWFEVESSTHEDAFTMAVDVEEWAEKPDTWEFSLKTKAPSVQRLGTLIKVKQLRPGVADELGSQSFVSRLFTAIGKTYAAFLDQGLRIRINGKPVHATEIQFLQGRGFQPLHEHFAEHVAARGRDSKPVKIDVEIWAGAAAIGSSDRPSADDEEVSMWGWYVLCNNRVVLSGDKSERSGWGLGFPQWHPQYNGFIGIIAFRSEDPYVLPWTTTKNDVDLDNTTLRRARTRMQKAARPYLTYSRARKANPDSAKKIERRAPPVPVTKLNTAQQMRTPAIPRTTEGYVNILYQRPQREVSRAATALGDPTMPASHVGMRTFEYFLSKEVE